MAKGKPIAVIGAGPVGTVLSGALAKLGQSVLLVESSDRRRAQLSSAGVNVIGCETISTRNPSLLASVDELLGYEIDVLFVCTKAWALGEMAPRLARAIGKGTLVISFQNGVGTEDELAEHIPESQVLRGIVNYAGGADLETGTVTLQWFSPPNFLGALCAGSDPKVAEVATLLTRAGLETQAISRHELKKQVFYKAILSCGLNALCSVSGITMRQAMAYPHTRALARRMLREALSVGAALGFTYGEQALDECMAYLDGGGDHMPSMYVDLQRGNPTEIEYINGKMVKIGSMYTGCDVSTNLFFTASVITLELKNGVRNPASIPDYLL